MKRSDSYNSVWDALSDNAEQAANLKARSELMIQIGLIVQGNEWTQTEAAKQCGISQPRMNDLLRGKLALFSLDALVNIAAKLGKQVHLVLEAA